MEAATAVDHLEGAGKILQAAAGGAPFVEVAHQHHRHVIFLLLGQLDDRCRLPPAPEAGQVKVHAEHRELLAGNLEPPHDRAARLEAGNVHDIMGQHACRLADQQGIAVPAHRVGLHVERDRLIIAVHFEQFLGNSSGSCTEAAIRLLQRDDIGIDFVQNIDDPARVAPSIRTYALVNIVACDLQHFGLLVRSEGIDGEALLLQQSMGGHRGEGHFHARQQVGIADALSGGALAAEVEIHAMLL